MKKILLALFLITGSLGVMAQKENDCGFINPPTSLRSDFASVYEASSYINTMLDRIDWQQNFQVKEQNGINNAYATIIRGQRYIVYDNRFLERLDSYAGTKWASISVLAHEMGHHYYNHMLNSTGSNPPMELQADFFSGYVMEKLGASLQEAEAAMSKIASPQASSTHPAKADRLDAIAKGWNSAKDGNSQTNTRTPIPAPQTQTYPRPQQRNEPVSNNNDDASWIHLSLYGNSNMTVYLSDDGRQFTPAQVKTNQPFVFKYEVYDYGWLRFGNDRNARTYKLYHGRDYAIVWSRRLNNWTVVEV
ncbi:MAG TPA: M48 family metalloprotease [Flavisolibacter sp.]|jgi:hypothetical protein|nr:M48 family metalloprotease [Flavisolibacter sp.]